MNNKPKTLLVVVGWIVRSLMLIWLRIRAMVTSLGRNITRWRRQQIRDWQDIRRVTASLPKVPKHLAFIFDDTHFGRMSSEHRAFLLSELMLLVLSVPGISRVSFYDAAGYTVDDVPLTTKLSRHLLDRYARIMKIPRPMVRLVIPVSELADAQNDSSDCTCLTDADLNVSFLSDKSGRDFTARQAKRLIRARLDEPNPSMITRDDLDTALTVTDFPEPQMAIIQGDQVRLHGFPAWQSRLTEFYCIPFQDSLDAHDFVDVLQCYSWVHRRHGR